MCREQPLMPVSDGRRELDCCASPPVLRGGGRPGRTRRRQRRDVERLLAEARVHRPPPSTQPPADAFLSEVGRRFPGMRDLLFPTSAVHLRALSEAARMQALGFVLECRAMVAMFTEAPQDERDLVHGDIAGTLHLAPRTAESKLATALDLMAQPRLVDALEQGRLGVGHAMALLLHCHQGRDDSARATPSRRSSHRQPCSRERPPSGSSWARSARAGPRRSTSRTLATRVTPGLARPSARRPGSGQVLPARRRARPGVRHRLPLLRLPGQGEPPAL